MSKVNEELTRRARACLSKTWDTDFTLVDQQLQRAFETGWRGDDGIGLRDSDYVSTHVAIGQSIPRALAEAMIAELETLGIALQRDRNTNYSISEGHFRPTELPQSYDKPEVDGFAITMPTETFHKTLAPALAQWRAQTRGARVA